jgi:hypothetical protein
MQYARRDLPKDRWNDVHVVRVCMVIAVVRACLMTISAVMSAVKHINIVQLPDWIYFYISMTNLVVGAVFTVWYKKRAHRQGSAHAQ